MNGALAIASVTALLKGLLEDGLVSRGIVAAIGADVQVSALPPDRVRTGEDERPQLNLFLYQVTPRARLRTPESPAPKTAEVGRRAPPLGLDLHYILSAHGSADLQMEILLGYGLQVLNDTAVIDSAKIGAALGAASSTADGRIVSPTLAAIGAAGLADQVDQISISPQFLSTEELSRLWSAFQTRLRPSASYKVSLVLVGGREDPVESVKPRARR